MKRQVLIVILVLLSALMYLKSSRPVNITDTGYGPAALTQIAELSTALNLFDVDCGRYPTTAEGLDALIHRPKDLPASSNWQAYLSSTTLPKDPWGRAFIYERPGKHNPATFDVYSLGPDGKGGDEAIGNWVTQ